MGGVWLAVGCDGCPGPWPGCSTHHYVAHPGIIGLPYIDPAAVYPAPAAGAGAAAGVVQPHDEILDYDYYNTAFFNSGVLHNVFMHLPLGDVMQYATVCSTWATVARDVRRQAAPGLANVIPAGQLIDSTRPRTGVEQQLSQTQQQLASVEQQLAQAQQRAAAFERQASELAEQVALLKVYVGDLEAKLAQQG